MTLPPLPLNAPLLRWRRLDVPGWEEAAVERTEAGWRLSGELEVSEQSCDAYFCYTIAVDDAWRTRLAAVDGVVGGLTVQVHLNADGFGQWSRDGQPLPALAGALDIDLAFTPATNLLPIRRLELAVGETREVRSAWFRFPELCLEPLEQTYTRESSQAYRYVARVDGELFSARLDTDVYGRILLYEGLWAAELPGDREPRARPGPAT